MRFCHVSVVKVAFACINHQADRRKRLFSHSVGCCGSCARWSDDADYVDTHVRKEDGNLWHDFDTLCCAQFRLKLSTYSLSRPHRRCTHYFPRISARFRLDYTLCLLYTSPSPRDG